jgi:hypothetical protein
MKVERDVRKTATEGPPRPLPSGPHRLAVDQFGNVRVTDNSNGRVRKIDAGKSA